MFPATVIRGWGRRRTVCLRSRMDAALTAHLQDCTSKARFARSSSAPHSWTTERTHYPHGWLCHIQNPAINIHAN
jgi:hypothetical protein